MNRTTRIQLALPFLCLLLMLIAIVVVWPRFDGLYGQDAFAYYNYSVGPLDQALRQDQLPPPFFWPPGFPLLMWLATTIVGAWPLAGQIVALSAGALVPLFTALLARELFVIKDSGRERSAESTVIWLPLLAGLLVGLQGQLWQSSVVVMSDTVGLAAGTAGVWLTARWGRTGGLPTLCLAAGLMAFAIMTRWAYALVAIPVTIFAVYRLLGTLKTGSRAGGWGRHAFTGHPLMQAFAAGLVVVVALLPVWLPASADLLAQKPAREVAFAGDLAVVPWSPIYYFQNSFTTGDGFISYRYPNVLYYVLVPAHRYFFTPLLALFLLPGFWRLWRMRTAATLWLVAGWAGITFGFLAGAPWQSFRFTLGYLPPLALIAALGMVTVWGWLKAWESDKRRAVQLFFVGYIIVGLGAMSWGGRALVRSFVERKQADLATVVWMEAQTPPEAHVLAFGLTLTLEHYSSRQTDHLFYQTPETVSELANSGQPLFVLLETDSFLRQWAGHQAEHSFRWLQEERGLLELGRDRQYVLYKVEGYEGR